jgi:predicted nucleotidyltransferase
MTLVVDAAASPCTRPTESYTTSMASASTRRLAVEEFVKRLRQGLSSHMLDVRLFGSEARGEATSESDIDVLVVVQPDTDRVQFEDRMIDIAFDVNLEFGVYISPRVVTPRILNDPVWRETPFIKNVARESIPL